MLTERLVDNTEYQNLTDATKDRVRAILAAAEGAADSGASGKDAVRDSIIQACLGSSEELAAALAAIDKA